MRIGVCGMGKMGSTIARRLMTFGHELTVWNRDAAKTAALVADGATAAATPADLAKGVELVITIVLDAAALDTVYRAPNGLLSADLTGKLIVDMSTVLPDVQQALAAEVIQRGGDYVECPVGGTVAPARDGKLFGLAGGTEAAVARARPVLDQLCRRVEHVGAIGAGARVKLAINLPLLVYWQALGEALSLCKSTGLSPEKMIDILADTTGAANGIKGRGPDIARGLGGADTGPGSFDISGARKDLETMLALARATGLDLPAAQAALGGYEEAIAAGRGGKDSGQLAVHWATRA
ncbi:MAG TPA: NAD(P)-dependent oxidoreductase [Acetobacteraceae bacterium]|jgi:3-hydroxyisobutyrate dehydrogenase|nr:NAD(P)-dependent oxidoreductase [Acetobacteraceae bacterium]